MTDTYEVYCQKELEHGIKAEYDYGRLDAIVTVMNDNSYFVQDCVMSKMKQYSSFEAAELAARMIVNRNSVQGY